jgi:hypothetical protein
MDPLSEAFQHHTWATEQLIGTFASFRRRPSAPPLRVSTAKYWPRFRT